MLLADLVARGGRFASTLGMGPDQLNDRQLDATAIMAMPTADVLGSLGEEVAAGRLRVPLQRTYSLEDVPQALADFAGGSLGKLGVTIDG
jgi:NADPH2:quinone reductase